MVTKNLIMQLSANASLDIRGYIGGTLSLTLDTGEAMPAAVKYASHTPHCFANGFPALRVPSKLRQQLRSLVLGHRPKSMLYLRCKRRIGMVLVGDAFAMIVREQNIVISPVDMNIIVSTIQSHPAVKRSATSLPICLPGVSNEGFLHLTIKYLDLLIGIIFVSLSQEQFAECLEKANVLGDILAKEGLGEKLSLAFAKFYITPAVSHGNPLSHQLEISSAVIAGVIKSNEHMQIATIGMPMMAKGKEEKNLLSSIEYMYQKSLSPREAGTKFEYLERRKTEALYVFANDIFTFVIIAKSTLTGEKLVKIKKRLKAMLKYDPEQFFIASYN